MGMPDVVLPVLNEREALPWVLERMPPRYEPIVVDNGSTDGSGELAARLGARTPTPDAVWPGHARAANAVHAFELRRRTGARLSDLGPMRAARREDLLALGVEDRRFGWPLEMVLRASAAGWRLREVPVSYLAREGRSKVTGTIRGTVRTVRDMSSVLR